jgi:hypothetical protein
MSESTPASTGDESLVEGPEADALSPPTDTASPIRVVLEVPPDQVLALLRAAALQRAAKRGPKLNPEVVATIKRRLKQGEGKSALAKEYGLTPASVYSIASGRTWGEVSAE